MTQRLRVLVVGTGAEKLEALHEIVADVVADRAELLALDVPRRPTDPGLAWGTEQVHLHRFGPAGGLGPAAGQPLAEDGDVWKAILAAATTHDIDVIVMASTREGWLQRAFGGSALRDVLANGERPVIAVPEVVVASSQQEAADGR